MVGSWEWDIQADRLYGDAFCALLFNLRPDDAMAGIPRSEFMASTHRGDRERVSTLIEQCARDGSSYIAEYRVHSRDGEQRWVLARGRFFLDQQGRPLRGQGIVVDITQSRGDGAAYVAREFVDDAPLDRAADYLIEVHKALVALEDPELVRLAEALLFQVGRRIATAEREGRRGHMN